jgi:hypothetical protein
MTRRVFISHSADARDEPERVRKLVHDIGFQAITNADIPAGANLQEAMQKAITECDVLVALVSQPSHGVGMEAQIAANAGMPIVLYDADKPTKLSPLLQGLPAAEVASSNQDLQHLLLRLPDDIPSSPTTLAPLSVYIEPGDAPEELITELFLTLSALHTAHGGSGLQIAKDEYRTFVPEGAP